MYWCVYLCLNTIYICGVYSDRKSFYCNSLVNKSFILSEFFCCVLFIFHRPTKSTKKERVKLLQLFCSYGFASLNSLTCGTKLAMGICMNGPDAYWFEFRSLSLFITLHSLFCCSTVTNLFFCLSFWIKRSSRWRRSEWYSSVGQVVDRKHRIFMGFCASQRKTHSHTHTFFSLFSRLHFLFLFLFFGFGESFVEFAAQNDNVTVWSSVTDLPLFMLWAYACCVSEEYEITLWVP